MSFLHPDCHCIVFPCKNNSMNKENCHIWVTFEHVPGRPVVTAPGCADRSSFDALSLDPDEATGGSTPAHQCLGKMGGYGISGTIGKFGMIAAPHLPCAYGLTSMDHEVTGAGKAEEQLKERTHERDQPWGRPRNRINT